ncbi:MAG TPA: S9 family peptidase [Planctomycetota bacterium]|jgi:dipeptidyl aminopeptidase/acylaminoacyl peptidase|nr:S9 family peptidase [Planctomycetota bacterium]
MILTVGCGLAPVLLAAASPAGGPGRGITAEDLYRLVEVRDARISPDGSKVLFTSVRCVRERNAEDADLFLVPSAGGEAQLLTTSEARDESGRWSPDGRWIAFTSKRSGTAQVWLIPVAGGEARALTSRPLGAHDPVFSPDGQRIAFLGRVPPEGKGRPAKGSGEKKGSGPVPGIEKDADGREFADDVRVIDRMVYRKETEYLDGTRTHLFVVPMAGGEPAQLTFGDFDVREFGWSPSGASIAFVANREGDPDLDRNDDVWVVSADGGEPRRLTPNDGPDHSPVWSPDGKWIAYVGTGAVADLKAEEDLWLVPAEGGEPRNLTASFDRNPESPLFAPNEPAILFRAADRGNVQVFSVPIEGGEVRRLIAGDRTVGDFSVSRDGNAIAFVASDPMHPPEVSLVLRDGTGEKALSRANEAFLAEVALAKPEELRVPSPGGREVHGWVMRPSDFDPSRKYPCVLYVHGGPYSSYGNRFFHEFQFLAARGFVVLYCNPRLSTGYGEEWTRAAGGEWGEPVFKDLTAALDHLISLGFVDGNRLGIAGGSFGGYMAAWAIAHSDRFKAALVERCVSDLLSFWGTTDLPRLVEMEFGGYPWDNLDRLRSQSPITWLGEAKTPTLLIAGELDWRTPPGQTEEVHRALRRRGIQAQMVVYPREGHELSRHGEPVHRVDRLNRIAAWFKAHLMPPQGPADTSGPATGGAEAR